MIFRLVSNFKQREKCLKCSHIYLLFNVYYIYFEQICKDRPLKDCQKVRRGKTALAILYDHDKCTKQTSAHLLILPRKIRFRLRYDMFIQGKILPQYDQDNQVFWLMILSYYKNENLARESKKGFFYRKGEVKMSTYRLREAYTPVRYGDHALLVPVEKLCNTP